MYVRSAGGAVLLLVLFFGFMGYGSYARGQLSDRYLTESYALVALCDKYRDEQGYIIGICDAAHEIAFDKAYTRGGRRRGSKMNESLYFSELFATMRDQAVSDRKQEVAESIVRLADEFATGQVVLEPH